MAEDVLGGVRAGRDSGLHGLAAPLSLRSCSKLSPLEESKAFPTVMIQRRINGFRRRKAGCSSGLAPPAAALAGHCSLGPLSTVPAWGRFTSPPSACSLSAHSFLLDMNSTQNSSSCRHQQASLSSLSLPYLSPDRNTILSRPAYENIPPTAKSTTAATPRHFSVGPSG